MNLLTYLRAIRQSWWLVLLAVLLGTAGGVYRNTSSTPIYSADVTFYVSTAASATSTAASGDQFAQARAVSYAKLLSSEILARRVIAATGLPNSPAALAAELTGSADLNTVLVTETVLDPSKGRALRIAKSVATEFPAMVSSFDNRSTAGDSVKLIVTSGPGVQPAPVLPRKPVNLLLGFGVGLILGLILALLRYLRDTSVRRHDEIEELTGAAVLATIEYEASAREQPLLIDGVTTSRRAEEFKQLRTGLQFVDAASELASLVITSPDEAEGKSTTAANLALVYAQSGWTVLLVDADLRRPRVAQYFGLEPSVGLSNVLAGQVELDEALQIWQEGSMYVLASGSLPPNPSELLGSPAMAELLTRLQQHFDMVIIDTPPMLAVTDAAVLAGRADGVLMVSRYGKTTRGKLSSAVRSLNSVNARLVGCVLTMTPAGEQSGSTYYTDSPPRRGRLGRLRSRSAGRRPVPDLPSVPLPSPGRGRREGPLHAASVGHGPAPLVAQVTTNRDLRV